MWAGSGGVCAIGVRVGSGESGRCKGGGEPGPVPRSAEVPAGAPGPDRPPRASRALALEAGRAGTLEPPGPADSPGMLGER